jgi:hypothetical protein
MPGIFHGRANVPCRAIERDICSLALPASHGPARGGEVAGNGRERAPHRHLLVRVSCSVSSSGTSLVLDPYAIGAAKVAFWVLHAALLMLSTLGADGPDACATVLLWALYFWAYPFPHTFMHFLCSFFFALESLFENKPSPPYTYGLGKVGTTSGSGHTTRQNRTEVKPDGAFIREFSRFS